VNYSETLLLIEDRQEKILAQDIRSLITNCHRYLRGINGEWSQDLEPGAPEEKYTRGGVVWIWKREMENV
jgi:hypothetical protein